jgi:HEAT repeat protein
MVAPTRQAAASGPPTRCARLLGFFLLPSALISVGCTGGKRVEDLTVQLHSQDAAMRLHAVQGLGERGSKAAAAVPALVEALKDGDAFVRRDAARALGQIGPAATPAVDALRSAAQDRNLQVRRAAFEALHKIVPGTSEDVRKR